MHMLQGLAGYIAVAGRIAAYAVQDQGAFGNAEFKYLFYHILYLLQARIAEFHHLAAFVAYQMIVLGIAVTFFVTAAVFAKFMLTYQLTFQQYIQGIIYRSTAYPVLFIFHFLVERLYIKMVCKAVYFFQDSVAFRRFTMPLLRQVVGKYGTYSF